MKLISSVVLLFAVLHLQAQQLPPAQPVPSERQLGWHDLEFYLFTHFGPNTFTDLEWGKGTEHEEVFNPTALDCRQWARIAKAAGAKGIIITAKHHDGFCLWPTKYSTHTVAQSKWRNGKGDVLKELAEACKEYGIKLGIYLSPWDRNHPKYGTDEYNEVFVNMMKEVVSRYGPLFEFWWDGANGEGPNGKKQVYTWHRFESTIREVAPQTPVFSDIGPDIRWVGNEEGHAGTTNWNLLDTAGFSRGAGGPSGDTLNQGNVNGKNWIPAECDVSIRPGWFYHQQEDDKVKTPQQLFNLFLQSVGRGSNLLLNVPPDRRGLINEHDSAALMGFKKLRDESFQKDLLKHAMVVNKERSSKAADRKTEEGRLLILKTPVKLNCIVLKEAIENGQLIKAVTIVLSNHGTEVHTIHLTTVGHKRILSFPAQEVTEVSVVVTSAKAKPQLKSVQGYLIADELVEQ